MAKADLEYPAALYKRDGTMLEWDGAMFDIIVINDPEEYEIALADGWLHPNDASKKPDPLDHDNDGKKGGSKPKAKAG